MLYEMFISASKTNKNGMRQGAYSESVICQTMDQARKAAQAAFSIELEWSNHGKLSSSQEVMIDGIKYVAIIETKKSVLHTGVLPGLPTKFTDSF